MPTFEYTVTGWKNGDDESDISTMPNVSAAVGNTNVLGDFLLSLQGGLDDNYYFIFNNGIMSVLEVLSTSNSAISFAVYPNPTTNYLKLEGVQLNAEIDILNAAGSVIHTGLLENGSVGVQSLKPGVYFGSVEGRIFRFVKE